MKYNSVENQFELYDHTKVEICNPNRIPKLSKRVHFYILNFAHCFYKFVSSQADKGGLGRFIICSTLAETMKQFSDSDSYSVGASAVLVEWAILDRLQMPRSCTRKGEQM